MLKELNKQTLDKVVGGKCNLTQYRGGLVAQGSGALTIRNALKVPTVVGKVVAAGIGATVATVGYIAANTSGCNTNSQSSSGGGGGSGGR